MTDVDLTPLIESFSEFFNIVYKEKIDELLLKYPDNKSLDVDYRDLEKFDMDLADKLIKEPDITSESARKSLEFLNKTTATGQVFSPYIRFYNIPGSDLLIENIGSENLSSMVSFKGVVTRRAEVMHKIRVAVYGCEICDSRFKFIVEKNFSPPKRCPSCKKLSLAALTDESTFTDVQRAEVQELLEKVRGGTPAAKIELWLEDDLVNSIVPGDNIETSGVLRLKPPQKQRSKQELLFGRFLDVNHIQSMKRDFEEIEITQEDERRILELSTRPDIDKLITNSLAPSIYGYEEIKKAIALQLFGGTRGKLIKGNVPVRDNIHILLIGDPGIAKCVEGSTKVILADGSIERVDNIVESVLRKKENKKVKDGFYAESNHDILSLDLDARVQSSKASVFSKLKSPPYLYQVETATGKQVITTAEHPFFISDNGFIVSKKTSEIKKGEFIATPSFIPVKGSQQKFSHPKKGRTNSNRVKLPQYLTPDFARLMGYLVGDGCIRKTKTSYEISLYNNCKEMLYDFKNILESCNIPVTLDVNKSKGVSRAMAFSIELGSIFESMDFVHKAHTKLIPKIVLMSPNYVLKEFIKSYFDCDGSVRKEGIVVVSASKDLLQSVQFVLLRFGIISQLHKTYSRATNAKNHKKSLYYRLNILGENARKYFDQIGFISEKNNSRAKMFQKESNTNIHVVPNLSKILKQLRKSLLLTQFDCGIKRTTYQHYERGDRNPSYSSLSKLVETFYKKYTKIKNKINNSDEVEKNIILLRKLSESHIFWDKIVSIEKMDARNKWVYDLQVDPTHNFVANGMIVHNSQFLQQSTRLAPKSIYVSGKSTTSAGLTVSAEKDELGDGGWTLKAGALVLASGGNVAIDEFDKISEEDSSSLHEVLESQTVSVAKAGMVSKFSAKTAVLAAANPKYGRFDQNRNIAEQFNIPVTLLSRFDLIFPIFDILDEEKDSKLADHILSSHLYAGRNEIPEDKQEKVDMELFRKYIAYARRNVRPVLTPEVMDEIKEYYLDLRRLGMESGSVAITPRYLEGLVRLSEANAKLRLSPIVEQIDSQIAINLMKYVLSKVMTDKETGRIDVDIVATGRSRAQTERMQKVDTVREIIKVLSKEYDSVDIEKIVEEALKYDVDEKNARRIITELLRKGELYEKEQGYIRLVGE